MLKKCALMLAVLGVTGPAQVHHAHAQGHDHGHAGPGRATDQLTLNKGKKWQTDATLQAAMVAIRNDVQAALPAIHGGTYSAEDYKGLAVRIEKQLAEVISKCKLPPEVDAQFHLVLAELFAGTDVMKQDGKRISGAVRVIGALGAYGDHFDHPGWKPIQH